jgi:hypothetical protein
LPRCRDFGLHVAIMAREQPAHTFYQMRTVGGMPSMEG